MRKTLHHLLEIPDPIQKNRARLEVSELYLRIRESKARVICLEGGVRSGKTFSIAQYLNERLQTPKPAGEKIEIVRKTMPALKATAMEDFFGIMGDLGLYDQNKHNKTDQIYREGKNSVGFFPVDDQQKLRGRKRDILWINEANELTYEEFKQLALRTTRLIILDFNPVEEDHWIVEKIFTRDDVEIIHSDYRCNPFLPPEIVAEIEMMRDADPNYWRVFGLGLRPIKGTRIYSHYTLVDEFPKNPDQIIYGIDFGFNNPSAVVRIGIEERIHTWDELLYKTHLTNPELIEELIRLRDAGLITESMQGYADTAEPARIEEINRAGFNVKPADKAVVPGIDFIKGRPLRFTKRSLNLIDEAKDYSWKTTKDGKILDEPVKLKDHLMDAGRYGEYTHGLSAAEGSARIRIL
ncbi:MAG TPA: PBSX family phage terminase large subunit [Candidatus Colwellbacteria bacterium]|nr:PBSX family phage terminase large subunit [Candidatus Colwellbacteria bacterium]